MKKFEFIIDIIFFSCLFLIFTIPPKDPDLGWQLACGKNFWQEKSFCQINTFSLLDENYHWPNHYFLYQAVIYPVYSHFGFWGLTFSNAFLLTSAFIFLYYSFKSPKFLKILAVLIIIYFSQGVFSLGVRGQETAVFYLSLLLFLFSKIKTEIPSRKNLLLSISIVATVLLWSNTHGSFILGLFIASFFTSLSKTRPFYLLLLAACFLVSFINPNFYHLYEEAFRHVAGYNLSALIAEWVPPSENLWLLVFFASCALFFALLLEEKKEDKLLALLIIPFSWLALKANRNLPFFFMIFFFLLLNAPKTKNLFKKFHYPLLSKIINCSLVFYLLFNTAANFKNNLPKLISDNSTWRNNNLDYPLEAVSFLNEKKEKGNIFNRYEWGGFLIWAHPNNKIFIDGRMPAWPTAQGKSPYEIYLETLQTKPGWEKTLAKYKINLILISPGTFMDLLLKDNPPKFGWKEIYRDKISVIYKKSSLPKSLNLL